MNPLAQGFLRPSNPSHRKYEALRAHFVDNLPMPEAAERFGYKLGTFRNLCTEFRKNPGRTFFEARKPLLNPESNPPDRARRRERAVALRKEQSLSINEISAALAREGISTSAKSVNSMLREAGLPKLWCRTPEQCEDTRLKRDPLAGDPDRTLLPRRLRPRTGIVERLARRRARTRHPRIPRSLHHDRFFAFANANVRKKERNNEVLRFAEEWRRIALTNVGRIYRRPRILDRRIVLRDYAGELRQITIVELGREKPTLVITNLMNTPARILVERQSRRMIIENTIADAINFFPMDALSAAVPLKVHLDIQTTIIASSLYRILAKRLGKGVENPWARTVFRKVVNTSAIIEIAPDEIVSHWEAASPTPSRAPRDTPIKGR